jgi:hypothetical protein
MSGAILEIWKSRVVGQTSISREGHTTVWAVSVMSQRTLENGRDSVRMRYSRFLSVLGSFAGAFGQPAG